MITPAATHSFGALLCDNGVRFRLWAPAATEVNLMLANGAIHPLQKAEAGFYEVFLAGLGAGTRYRYQINGTQLVPDPAARYQPDDILGYSEVVDPQSYQWLATDWVGRPWVETVIYELHIGTFTAEGTYRAAQERLAYLVELGITAIELMPLAEAPGQYNWGYDGVLLYAPERTYGHPDELKALIDAAHGQGLMVFLDVVYNHFGPQGNYLNLYAPDFFTEQRKTPWGSAIALTGPKQAPVRQFFIENALMWLEEYRFDGLRFDAAHELHDRATPAFLDIMVSVLRQRVGPLRPIHLVLENEDNNVRLLSYHRGIAAARYDAQWNDDIHHALHVVATGESIDYYRDYADDPIDKLILALSEGFAYQGEMSVVRDRRRGSPSAELPPVSFVSFLQNHDQVGNRAFGERLGHLVAPHILRALIPLVTLSPMIPMLFMGEEWNASTPFLYFCDFEPDLAKLVTEGRRNDFSGFPDYAIHNSINKIPDPCAPSTFERSRLKWEERTTPEHAPWHALYRNLLQIRRQEIIPYLAGCQGHAGHSTRLQERAFAIRYLLAKGAELHIVANLGDESLVEPPHIAGRLIYSTNDENSAFLAPWSVCVYHNMRVKP